ncbi:methyl-accepting chemotaxis protein, partial [Natroniella sulfidigena]|uniref:methyl-accepting chemotaxis protein n=1 Tax=Natroniella sulfidigena TaxID=723921 RepID=UPI00200AE9E0
PFKSSLKWDYEIIFRKYLIYQKQCMFNSIKHKLSIIFLLFLGLNLIGFIVVYNSLQEQEADGRVINVAGAQRMLSQRMSKEALELISIDNDLEEQRARLENTITTYDTRLQGLIYGNQELGLPGTEEETILEQMHHVEALWEDFNKQMSVLLDSDTSEVEQRRALEYIVANNMELLEEMDMAVGLYEAEANRKTTRLITIQIILIILNIILAISSYLFAKKLIIKPIIKFKKEVLNNDLTSQLNITSQDEIGEMAVAINKMKAGLREIIIQMQQKIEDLSAYSEELSASAEEGNATIETTNELIDHTSVTIEEISASAEEVASFSEEVNSQTNLGSQNIDTTVNSINEINEVVRETVGVINNLDSTSKEIGQIIEIITNIAEQTNLLALNAAIEAARAGEEGRGFNVVAEEIRQLAGETAEATDEIASLVSKTQKQSKIGIEKVKELEEKAKEGQEITEKTGEVFDKIKNSVQETSIQIEETASATKELAQVSDEISSATEDMSNMSGEISNSSQELAQMAQELHGLVEQFKV